MDDTRFPITVVEKESFKDNPLFARLLELHDVPDRLFIRGTIPEVTIDEYGRLSPRILTVVGSRKNSTYGRQALESLIGSLSGYDVIIISGLAYGIDSLAHGNAIKNNLLTIAVPGSGLNNNVLYPSAHRQLAADILEQGGALLSEFTNDTKAAPYTFPLRNRIMAALSDALLIIEAEEKSGTLITARVGIELGRDVGAVPGEIFSSSSQGTNMLIREGAYSITSITDLLSLLHICEAVNTNEKTTETDYSPHESLLLELLREPLDKDELATLSQLSYQEFIIAYSSLEIKGAIEETFGEVRKIV